MTETRTISRILNSLCKLTEGSIRCKRRRLNSRPAPAEASLVTKPKFAPIRACSR